MTVRLPISAARLGNAAAVMLAALILSPAAARAQQTEVKLEGRCEKLVIADQDITQNCKESFVNAVVGNRTSFDFAAWDGQTLSFSGVGTPREATELTDPLQPISLVIPGRKEKDSIVRNPTPAVGSCRFTRPEPGKSMITCEASAQGKSYAAIFITDVKPAAPNP